MADQKINIGDLIHDEQNQQFSILIDGEHKALVDYKQKDDKFYLVHSEVPYQLRGQGIGKILVDGVLDYLRDNDIEAVPVCSYIRAVAARR